MFQNYVYEKPSFIGQKNTDALTASFAGGGWLHLNDHRKKDEINESLLRLNKKEVLQ
jgi:hypothetical protein